MPLNLMDLGMPPLVVGCAAGLLALAVAVSLTRRRSARALAELDSLVPTTHFQYLRTSGKERRQSARRLGTTVTVEAMAEGWKKPVSGWVVDRSMGGVRLELAAATRSGEVLEVVLRDKSGSTHAFRVEVVHCQRGTAGWEAGCRFQDVPPTEVLWLLG